MRISVGAGSGVTPPIAPQGRLAVTPAHYQTGGGEINQLDSANDWIASKVVPQCDFELQALSRYVASVASEGVGTIEIYSDGTALEPNGDFNASETRCHEDMTSASAPSPLVCTYTNQYPGNEAYKVFDGSDTSYWQANADPAVTPQSVAIDLGDGNDVIVNKYGVMATATGYPQDFTLWGSNMATPDVDADGDWTQLDSQTGITNPGQNKIRWFSFTNSVSYRHYRLKTTEAQDTGNLYIRELLFIQAQEASAPGSLLQSLGTLSSGSSAGWQRLAIPQGNRYQFQRSRPVWIVEKGQTSKDYSVSTRRVHTGNGSMPPDEMRISKKSTDAGAKWTRCLQDGVDASWNIILNSTSNHVPQLLYGRYNGRSFYVNGSILDIPEEGIFLDCSSLNEVNQGDTPYNIYLYLDSGALTLEASTTGVAATTGIEHKDGDPSRVFVGKMAPREIQSGHSGPIDVPDLRLLWNRYNRRIRRLGKRCPYTSQTTLSLTLNDGWKKFNDGDDWKLSFVCHDQDILFHLHTVINTSHSVAFSVGLDEITPYENQIAEPYGTQFSTEQFSLIVSPSKGYHEVWPIHQEQTGVTEDVYYYYELGNRMVTSGFNALIRS